MGYTPWSYNLLIRSPLIPTSGDIPVGMIHRNFTHGVAKNCWESSISKFKKPRQVCPLQNLAIFFGTLRYFGQMFLGNCQENLWIPKIHGISSSFLATIYCNRSNFPMCDGSYFHLLSILMGFAMDAQGFRDQNLGIFVSSEAVKSFAPYPFMYAASDLCVCVRVRNGWLTKIPVEI